MDDKDRMIDFSCGRKVLVCLDGMMSTGAALLLLLVVLVVVVV